MDKVKETVSRRRFLQASGMTISVIVMGEVMRLTPSQAYAKEATTRVLTKVQTTTLEVVAEALVPESRIAGVSQFIDSQLFGDNEESLLMLKYFGVPQPHTKFYQAALNAISSTSQSYFKKDISKLNVDEMRTFISMMAQDAFENWEGPAASFAFFVLRSDAVDVVYGIESGFSKIGMPTMEHIKPTKVW